MSRMFTPEPSLPGAPNASLSESEPFSAATADATDFEFVLGRRQIASVSLVGLTILAAFTGGAYMVGKATVPAPVQQIQPKKIEIIPPTPAPTAPEKAVVPEAPLFGTPEKDQRYLQLGSVERGFATLMVQGARKAGFPAIVAGGTNPNVFRVLVGPLPDAEQYQSAKTHFTSLGLEPFLRKYGTQENSETPEP